MPDPASVPTVSIAIPTYNRIFYLRKAIQCALAQTYPHIEVIVSDNASSDGTADYVSSLPDPRLVFFRQQTNLGMAGNWDACLERATGELFLLLSDDDDLEATAVEEMVSGLVNAPAPEKVAAVYCRTWEIDPDDRKQRIDPLPPHREAALDFAMAYFAGGRALHPCSTLFRTADIRRIGGYAQGTVTLAVDAIIWSRLLLERGELIGISKPLASYRIHPGRTTSTWRIELWRHDIRSLIEIWVDAFRQSPPKVRRKFQQAARRYESFEIAAIINQSAQSWPGRIQALGTYFHCRECFAGLIGLKNLLGGLLKLVVPEAVKDPVRKAILRRQIGGRGI